MPGKFEPEAFFGLMMITVVVALVLGFLGLAVPLACGLGFFQSIGLSMLTAFFTTLIGALISWVIANA